MYHVTTIFLLTLVGLQALAKIQIPFQKINLKPFHEMETSVQTPLAVAPNRFEFEVSKDCRDFSNTMTGLQDKGLQIQISDYDEIRFRALALSMRPNYEVQLTAEKLLNFEPAFESATILKQQLTFNFSKQSLSPEAIREKAKEYIELIDLEEQNYFILQFKSRDLFCDYYYGKLQITVLADLELQINSVLYNQTEQKLKNVLDSLNEGLKLSANKKTQAAHLGIRARSQFQKSWKESLKTIFSELVSKEDLVPNSFWSEKQSDFYILNFSKLHNISEHKIILKGKFNE